MSLDIFLECPHCKIEVSENRNYTYNVSNMWCKAMGHSRMLDIDGMLGQQSIPVLNKAIDVLSDTKWDKMNPENNWGSRKTFVEFLSELLKDAIENPKAIWRTWR